MVALARAGERSGYRRLVEEVRAELEETPLALRATRAALLDQTQKRFAHLVAEAEPAGTTAISKIDTGEPVAGVSLVAACMNREENLLKVLDSWLATTADEIIIVDWSSDRELRSVLAPYTDTRLKILRISGEKRWILSHALNVGLRFASREVVFKVDCDIELGKEFFKKNTFGRGEFRRGFWKLGLESGGEGQQYINGTFGAFKRDLRSANYYNEAITTYGWDDSDLYIRLTHGHGLSGRLVDPHSLRHIDQTHEQRLANQDVSPTRFLGQFEPSVFESEKNMFYAIAEGTWGTYSLTQDYGLLELAHNFFEGKRTTSPMTRNPSIERLSETLAARQLAVSAFGSMGHLERAAFSSPEVARLLCDAHVFGRSMDLVERIRGGQGVIFVRCEEMVCRKALSKTVETLISHYAAFKRFITIVEDAQESEYVRSNDDDAGHVIRAPLAAFAALKSIANAESITTMEPLIERLVSGSEKSVSLSISVKSMAEAVIQKARQVQAKLQGQYQSPHDRLNCGAYITSLYDEHNLLRLPEYMACIVLNVEIFERVAICYESSSGLLAAVLHEIADQMALALGRLMLFPYQKRPTFEELFSLRTLFPLGTIVAVANADIAFDASFARISELDLSKTVAILSRRDISEDGTKASLIRLENGLPNTFSADAWIFSTPFEADFFLDYPIGSFHCDSFINHQISTSSRYGVVNLCLDINAFHLHDDRFNSSAEKQRRDAEVIQTNYGRERERNGGVDPLKGVAWSTVTMASLMSQSVRVRKWMPKGILLQLSQCAEITFGHLVLLHWLLADVLREIGDAVVQVGLKRSDFDGPFGHLLARYLEHFAIGNVDLNLDEELAVTRPSVEGVLVRHASFCDVGQWMSDGGRDKAYEFVSWPNVAGVNLLRCEVSGEFTTESTLRLLNRAVVTDKILPDLIALFNALPNYSREKNLLAPFVVPYMQPMPVPRKTQQNKKHKPAVSFVTSLFRGGAFLGGYLENVLTAAERADGEVIIIDANPDDADERVVKEFLHAHPAAHEYMNYQHLSDDPGLYACWQLAIDRARAELITNANIDDRRCQYHTARLVQLLNQRPEMAGACGSISCVRVNGATGWFNMAENEVWFYGDGIAEIGFSDLYKISESGAIMSRNVMHCMPVWRKNLHGRYGRFDEEKYGTSADWAFWLKCASVGERFLFDEGAFGRYFLNPDSHNRRNDLEGAKERRIIKDLLGQDQASILKQ